jgi:hypothetical protein
VARLDKAIADLAREFVLLSVGNMRGVDLDLFDFDYDLTWFAFFLNADGRVYGRYGGRDADSPGKYLSLAGLRYAMAEALDQHGRAPRTPGPVLHKTVRTAERYQAARQRGDGACIHCHHVNEFRREAEQAAGTWRAEDVWVYPLPVNVGLTLDKDQGNRVRAVADGSAADRAGLRAGDRIRSVGGRPVASFADLQYALHRAPARGRLPVVWERPGAVTTGSLALAAGWRETDLSWRWSLRNLGPSPGVYGDDLTAAEKQALGLGAKRLAFRQGSFVPPAAQRAGIQQQDIILGVDGRHLEMTARQFDVYVRLNYRVGDEVTFNLVRAGKRADVPMKLAR